MVTSLFYFYSDTYNQVNLIFEIESTYLNVETAIPCGMIINEIVTNSFKYAFKDQQRGEIKISLKADSPQKYNLMIHDNGIGFPENFNWEETQSLGLNLVKLLSRQLDGSIQLETDGVGVGFHLIFHELRYKSLKK